jgi:hypothetical protein
VRVAIIARASPLTAWSTIVANKNGVEVGSPPHRRRIAAGAQRLEMVANEIRAGKLDPHFNS